MAESTKMTSPQLEEEIKKLHENLNRAVVAIEERDQQIVGLKETVAESKNLLLEQKQKINELTAEPLMIGAVGSVWNEINPKAYEVEDTVVVVDENHEFYGHYGKVASPCTRGGNITVDFFKIDPETGASIKVATCQFLAIVKREGVWPQVRLVGKSDGSFIVVTVDGNTYKLQGQPQLQLEVGDAVFVNMQAKQVTEKANNPPSSGSIAYVKSIIDENIVEVEQGGNAKIVSTNKSFTEPFEEGDRVVLCHGGAVIQRKLKRDNADEFRLKSATNICWDDIAGLLEAKRKIYNTIVLPHKSPEIVEFYNRKTAKGILFYGPPGCGKTLCGKAVATQIAELHGVEAMQSGFIYVKGPEILTKWVGESERKIRELFSRGEKHYEKHNYPAILFIDEADAILSERGTTRSSDVDKTIVPMFLSLMDGLTENHIIVILATNRPNHLDPAAIRDGRCDEHIKINRPNENEAPDYFNIHLRNVPLNGIEIDELSILATQFVYTGKPIYKVQAREGKTLEFCLKDAVNGGMIAGIIKKAVDHALERDLADNLKRGVRLEDFQIAIDETYRQQFDINHSFDLEDFADTHGVSYDGLKASKIKI